MIKEIDLCACTGCGFCELVCQMDVIKIDRENREAVYRISKRL